MYKLSAVRILATQSRLPHDPPDILSPRQYLQSHPVPPLPHRQPRPRHLPLIPQPHGLSRYSNIGPRVIALVDNTGQRLVSAVFNKKQNAQTTDLILIYQVRLAQWSMRHWSTPSLVIGILVSTRTGLQVYDGL